LSYTQADLIREALATLGALDASNTPAAEDVAKVTPVLGGLVADLVARRVVPAVDLSAIGDAYFPDLVLVLAERLAPQFGRPTNPETLNLAELRLGQSARLAATDALTQAVLEQLDVAGAMSNAFDAAAVLRVIQRTLDELTARRVIAIANPAAVTPEQFRLLVTVIASRCVPDKIAGGADAELALANLARLARTGSTRLTRAVLEQMVIWQGTSAADATMIEASLEDELANLAARNVIYFADEDSVPQAAWRPLVRYLAALYCPPAIADAYGSMAERELRTLARIGKGSDGLLTVDAALKPRRGPGRFDFTRGV
jgi:hypothetical protein